MNKYAFLPAVLATSIVGFGLIASPASAASLVPQEEGEIDTGFGGIQPTGYTVTSEIDSTTGTKSRLFVDHFSTANTYGAIKFEKWDEGISSPPEDYWFRPVALNPNGTPIENGRKEIGTFTFNFTNTISKLDLTWFDVEDFGTSILAVNGIDFDFDVPAGPDSNYFSYSLTNVDSITLKLGNYQSTKIKRGDGVYLEASVPEPGVTVGLSALALGGLLKLRRKQKEA